MAGEDLKQCPDCAEQVRSAARICRFCGYSFATAMSWTARSGIPDAERPGGMEPDQRAEPDKEPGSKEGTSLGAGLTPAPEMATAAPLRRRRATPGARARADFVPEWNAPIPAEQGPLVLEPLPPLPPLGRSGPFLFGFGTLVFIVLMAVGLAAYLLAVLPTSTPLATPSAAVSAPPATPDPVEIAAQYQSFADVAGTGYTGAAGLYAQIAAGSASASEVSDLVSSLQTTSDTLDSIAPAPCFSTLYAQMVSLDRAALTDAQALAGVAPGADTGAIISHLGSDLGSWQTFIKSQLIGNRCGSLPVAPLASPSG